MPKSQEYSIEVKAIDFRVIDFIEREQKRPVIPLNLTTARILAILGISEKSLFNFKAEIKQVQEGQKIEDQLKYSKSRRLRSHTISDTSISSISSASVCRRRQHQFSTTRISQISFVSVPTSVLPKKIANCGRPQIHISE